VKNLPRNWKNANRKLGLSTFDEVVPPPTNATSANGTVVTPLPPAVGGTTTTNKAQEEDDAYLSEDEIEKRKEMADMKKKKEDEMDAAAAANTKQKFLPTSEVETRIATLWSFGVESRMLEEIYGKMLHGDTIEVRQRATTHTHNFITYNIIITC
jgi:hypothetical protein